MCTAVAIAVVIAIIIIIIIFFSALIYMRLYILRHEDRTMDASFFSPLTKDGLDNSVKLIEILNKEKIDMIFSSPFIRTLQTIYPYSKSKKYKINVEHALAEIQHPHIIPCKSYTITLPQYIAEQFNCDEGYKSTLDPNNHMYPEDEKNVCNRSKAFVTKIIKDFINTEYNIILVTHQIVCNCILKKITKNMKNINITSTYNYMRGSLTLIFDKDDWAFEPINWKYTE